MALVWSSVRAAVHAFVVAASGLSDQLVGWADQDLNSPDQDAALWIVLHQGGIVPLSSQDEKRQTYDAARGVGQEIEFEVVGPRSVTFKVEAFGVAPFAAQDLLSQVKTKLQLPILRGGLTGAGIGVLGKSEVRNTSAVRNADFESRAEFEIRCHVSETATERTGYIDRAEIGAELSSEADPNVLRIQTTIVIDSSP